LSDSEENLFKIYNTLTEVEASFRVLKTDLALRPVYHQTDENILAHINLGILAYQVVSTIRHQLKQHDITYDWQHDITYDWSNIIRIMNTQKIVTNSMMNKQNQKIIVRICSSPSKIFNDRSMKIDTHYTIVKKHHLYKFKFYQEK